jgi:hypothetical protein
MKRERLLDRLSPVRGHFHAVATGHEEHRVHVTIVDTIVGNQD